MLREIIIGFFFVSVKYLENVEILVFLKYFKILNNPEQILKCYFFFFHNQIWFACRVSNTLKNSAFCFQTVAAMEKIVVLADICVIL